MDARLRDKKDMYKDLALSDALARELRRVPEEDQTIKVRSLVFTNPTARMKTTHERRDPENGVVFSLPRVVGVCCLPPPPLPPALLVIHTHTIRPRARVCVCLAR